MSRTERNRYIEDLGRAPQGPDLITARIQDVAPGRDFLAAAVEGFQMAMYTGAALMIVGLVLHVAFIRRRDVENIDVSAPPTAHVG